MVDGLPLCQECYSQGITPAGLCGWICPRCGRGNSPYIAQCPCNVNYRTKITHQ